MKNIVTIIHYQTGTFLTNTMVHFLPNVDDHIFIPKILLPESYKPKDGIGLWLRVIEVNHQINETNDNVIVELEVDDL